MTKLREREAMSNKRMQERLINNNIEKAKVEKRDIQYKAFLKLRSRLDEVVLVPEDTKRTKKNELFKRVSGRR